MTNARIQAFFVRCSQTACTLALFLSLLVVTGWLVAEPALTALLFGRVPVKPLVAVFLAAASAAVLAVSLAPQPAVMRIGRLTGLVILACSAAAVARHLQGIHAGYDRLVTQLRIEMILPINAGQMEFATAVALVFLGGALSAVGWVSSSRTMPSQPLAALAGILAVSHFAALAFVRLDGPALPGATNPPGAFLADLLARSGTPGAAAVLIALVSFGLVFCRPVGGFAGLLAEADAAGFMARRMVAAALAMPALAAAISAVAGGGLHLRPEQSLGLALAGCILLICLAGVSAARAWRFANRKALAAEQRRQELLQSERKRLLEAEGRTAGLEEQVAEKSRILHEVRARLAVLEQAPAAVVSSAGDGRLQELEAEVARRTQELERLRESLRTSEAEQARFQSVARLLDTGVIITDAFGRIEWVNDSFTRLTGWSLAEVRGRTPGSFLQGAGTDPAVVEYIRAKLRAGEAFQTEILNHDRQGREYAVQLSVQPVRDNTGRVQSYIGIHAPAAGSPAASEEVRDRQLVELADFKKALDEATVVCALTPEGVITHVNDNFCSVSGWNRGQLIGRNIDAIDSGLHAPGFHEQMRATLAGGGIWRGEISHRARDGSVFWLNSTYVPFLRPGGRPWQFTGVSVDITAEKAATAALEASSGNLSLAHRLASLGYWEMELDTGRMRLSHEFLLLLGVEHRGPATMLLAEFSRGFVHADDAPRLMQEIENARAGVADPSGRRSFEYRIRRGDGAVRYLQTSYLFKTGEPGWISGVSQDVTERIEAAGRLQAALEDARAADQAKGRFLAVMSHELRTPLNAIIGFNNLLQATPLSGDQREYCATVQSSADSLLGLIDAILDYTRIDQGQLVLEKTRFSPDELVASAVERRLAAVAARGLEIVYWIDDAVPRSVEGDAGRITQVLDQLLDNAVKFTTAGEIEIGVTLAQRDTRHPVLEIAVRDTGSGMTAAQVEGIFQPFTQADSSMSRKFGGTGLGLTISLGLARLLGGDLEVQSREGRGSIFRFRFQCSDPADAGGPRVEAMPEFTGRRVFLLVANRLQRDNLGAVLSAAGLDVVMSDPGAGVVPAGLGARDVLFYDASVRSDNGVAAALLALAGRHGVPVVALGEEPVEGCKPWQSLPRPPRPAVLLAACLKALQASAEAAAPRPPAEAVPDAASSPPPGPPTAVPTRPRILLVEDNPINQRMAGLLLKRMKCDFDTASNGLACLEALRQRSYDAILMDCQMPELDGYETTARIRQGEAGPALTSIYIIALTAHALEGDREKCLAAGMNDYLSKPLRPEELSAALERAAVHI